jgi:polyisoprenoid-binding protein YceI
MKRSLRMLVAALRDDDLRRDNFLNAEKFPTITFKSKRVQNVRPGGSDLVDDLNWDRAIEKKG